MLFWVDKVKFSSQKNQNKLYLHIVVFAICYIKVCLEDYLQKKERCVTFLGGFSCLSVPDCRSLPSQ